MASRDQKGTTRSALLRAIPDRELNGVRLEREVQDGFAALADGYAALTHGLFDDDPDLRIDR